MDFLVNVSEDDKYIIYKPNKNNIIFYLITIIVVLGGIGFLRGYGLLKIPNFWIFMLVLGGLVMIPYYLEYYPLIKQTQFKGGKVIIESGHSFFEKTYKIQKK